MRKRIIPLWPEKTGVDKNALRFDATSIDREVRTPRGLVVPPSLTTADSMSYARIALLLVLMCSTRAASQLPGQKILIGEIKLSRQDACPANHAANWCAPEPGPRLLYRQFAPPVPIEAGEPRWSDFVGGVIDDDDITGTPPTMCSATGVSPFTNNDVDIDVAPFTIAYDRHVISSAKAKASTDIVKALELSGVPAAKLSGISADLSAAWDRGSMRTTSMTSKFVVVSLKNTTLNRLRANSPPPYLAACAAMMQKNPNVRMIKAVSAYVLEQGADSIAVNTNIKAEIAAALRARGIPDAAIVSATASFDRTTATTISRLAGKRSFLVASTFYDP